MKKVIALSWDKLFLSCSQFESKLASTCYKTAILSSGFVKESANGRARHHYDVHANKTALADKFSYEEICQRFAYLKSLLASGYDLIIITTLEGQSATAITDLLAEQGLSASVISANGNIAKARLNISYDIYINYDWFKLMPAIIIAPDFYLVKSAIFLRICLFKVKKLLPIKKLQRA
ncbi:MAG TPA: hypothetical protein PLJ58_01195 [bacterium]|nr:hypothetical protein [bacterium]